jgi:hypothetical protein
MRALKLRPEHPSLDVLLNRLNSVECGWFNYFRHGGVQATFGQLDAFIGIE